MTDIPTEEQGSIIAIIRLFSRVYVIGDCSGEVMSVSAKTEA
jgi:hypothetical protein